MDLTSESNVSDLLRLVESKDGKSPQLRCLISAVVNNSMWCEQYVAELYRRDLVIAVGDERSVDHEAILSRGLGILSQDDLFTLAKSPWDLVVLHESIEDTASDIFLDEWEQCVGISLEPAVSAPPSYHKSPSTTLDLTRTYRRTFMLAGVIAAIIVISFVVRPWHRPSKDVFGNFARMQGTASYLGESGNEPIPISVHVTLPKPRPLYVTLVLLPLDSGRRIDASDPANVVFENDDRFVYYKEAGEQEIPLTETEVIFQSPLDDEDQRAEVSIIAIASRKSAVTEIQNIVHDIRTADLDSSRPDDFARKILESLALKNADIVGWGQFPLRPASPD